MSEIPEFTTPLGCAVRVLRTSETHPHLGPGVMLELRMVDPFDDRRAEVFLPAELAADVGGEMSDVARHENPDLFTDCVDCGSYLRTMEG